MSGFATCSSFFHYEKNNVDCQPIIYFAPVRVMFLIEPTQKKIYWCNFPVISWNSVNIQMQNPSTSQQFAWNHGDRQLRWSKNNSITANVFCFCMLYMNRKKSRLGTCSDKVMFPVPSPFYTIDFPKVHDVVSIRLKALTRLAPTPYKWVIWSYNPTNNW